MKKHTPGPWTAENTKCMNGWLVFPLKHPDGANYAHLCGWNGGALSEANARLIAAAPDLLEALLNVVCCPAFTGELFKTDKDSHKAWTLARAAIAKATGQTK